MKLIALEEVTEDVGSAVRPHFAELLKQRAPFMEAFESTNLEMRSYLVDNWPEARALGSFIFLENSGFKFPLRIKEGEFIWLPNYDLVHLRNSVISNILLPEARGEIKKRLDRLIYLFYHYWFMKKDGTIDDLTHNACFELQEVIKQLIDKELTLYRSYDTARLIDSVRWRLSSENLLLLARVQPVNLRRL